MSNDVIENIGGTEGSKQLAIHVSHEDPDAIVVGASFDGELVGATIIFASEEIMLNDALLAQVFVAVIQTMPDSVDVQHIGIIHELEDENETD